MLCFPLHLTLLWLNIVNFMKTKLLGIFLNLQPLRVSMGWLFFIALYNLWRVQRREGGKERRRKEERGRKGMGREGRREKTEKRRKLINSKTLVIWLETDANMAVFIIFSSHGPWTPIWGECYPNISMLYLFHTLDDSLEVSPGARLRDEKTDLHGGPQLGSSGVTAAHWGLPSSRAPGPGFTQSDSGGLPEHVIFFSRVAHCPHGEDSKPSTVTNCQLN